MMPSASHSRAHIASRPVCQYHDSSQRLWCDLLGPPECRKSFTVFKMVLDLVFIVMTESRCFVAGKDDGVG
jgi:hypothetical protein